MEVKQGKEAPAIVSSITEVVPCPMAGYAYVSLKHCEACSSHHSIKELGPGPASGREMKQVTCLFPKARPVQRTMLELSMPREVIMCPKFKALLPVRECMECELHKGTTYKDGIEQMFCGLPVNHHTTYLITGAQEV